MLNMFAHAIIHHIGEAIAESEFGKEIKGSIDDGLTKAGEKIKKTGKNVAHTLGRGIDASKDGISAAIQSYKQSK